MAIDFKTTFGGSFNNRGNGKAQDDRPKAQYWLNVGYNVDFPTEDGGTEERFVSLPTGIPLDTQELLKTNSQNETFANFQAARNDLLDQLLTQCKGLEPGEAFIIGLPGGLSLQMRRVSDEKAPAKAADNVFVKRLAFA